jgi:hypothetical protein
MTSILERPYLGIIQERFRETSPITCPPSYLDRLDKAEHDFKNMLVKMSVDTQGYYAEDYDIRSEAFDWIDCYGSTNDEFKYTFKKAIPGYMYTLRDYQGQYICMSDCIVDSSMISNSVPDPMKDTYIFVNSEDISSPFYATRRMLSVFLGKCSMDPVQLIIKLKEIAIHFEENPLNINSAFISILDVPDAILQKESISVSEQEKDEIIELEIARQVVKVSIKDTVENIESDTEYIPVADFEEKYMSVISETKKDLETLSEEKISERLEDSKFHLKSAPFDKDPLDTMVEWTIERFQKDLPPGDRAKWTTSVVQRELRDMIDISIKQKLQKDRETLTVWQSTPKKDMPTDVVLMPPSSIMNGATAIRASNLVPGANNGFVNLERGNSGSLGSYVPNSFNKGSVAGENGFVNIERGNNLESGNRSPSPSGTSDPGSRSESPFYNNKGRLVVAPQNVGPEGMKSWFGFGGIRKNTQKNRRGIGRLTRKRGGERKWYNIAGRAGDWLSSLFGNMYMWWNSPPQEKALQDQFNKILLRVQKLNKPTYEKEVEAYTRLVQSASPNINTASYLDTLYFPKELIPEAIRPTEDITYSSLVRLAKPGEAGYKAYEVGAIAGLSSYGVLATAGTVSGGIIGAMVASPVIAATALGLIGVAIGHMTSSVVLGTDKAIREFHVATEIQKKLNIDPTLKAEWNSLKNNNSSIGSFIREKFSDVIGVNNLNRVKPMVKQRTAATLNVISAVYSTACVAGLSWGIAAAKATASALLESKNVNNPFYDKLDIIKDISTIKKDEVIYSLVKENGRSFDSYVSRTMGADNFKRILTQLIFLRYYLKKSEQISDAELQRALGIQQIRWWVDPESNCNKSEMKIKTAEVTTWEGIPGEDKTKIIKKLESITKRVSGSIKESIFFGTIWYKITPIGITTRTNSDGTSPVAPFPNAVLSVAPMCTESYFPIPESLSKLGGIKPIIHFSRVSENEDTFIRDFKKYPYAGYTHSISCNSDQFIGLSWIDNLKSASAKSEGGSRTRRHLRKGRHSRRVRRSH